MSLGLILLLLALGAATATDLLSRRVPNALILSGLFAALAYHGATDPGDGILSIAGGAIGLPAAFGGIAVGFAALFPLYALRAMAAGDVKLMMVVGAFLGPLQTVGVVVLTFAAGGVLAIAMTIWKRSFRQLALNLRFLLTTGAIQAATGASTRFEPLQQTVGRMPYAVAIAAGTLLQLFLVRSGGWALS